FPFSRSRSGRRGTAPARSSARRFSTEVLVSTAASTSTTTPWAPAPAGGGRGRGGERAQDRRRRDRVPDEGEAAVLRLGAPLRPARAVHAPRTVRDEARRASLRRRDRLHGRAGGPARGGGARARRVGADHPGR